MSNNSYLFFSQLWEKEWTKLRIESDIRSSMVTHTRNSCSAFNPSKVHTHREHTPGAVGRHLCCSARGAVGGSVSCSRAPQSWYWGWRESAVHSLPPTYNSCRPETRTRNLLDYESNSLTIRPRLPQLRDINTNCYKHKLAVRMQNCEKVEWKHINIKCRNHIFYFWVWIVRYKQSCVLTNCSLLLIADYIMKIVVSNII